MLRRSRRRRIVSQSRHQELLFVSADCQSLWSAHQFLGGVSYGPVFSLSSSDTVERTTQSLLFSSQGPHDYEYGFLYCTTNIMRILLMSTWRGRRRSYSRPNTLTGATTTQDACPTRTDVWSWRRYGITNSENIGSMPDNFGTSLRRGKIRWWHVQKSNTSSTLKPSSITR